MNSEFNCIKNYIHSSMELATLKKKEMRPVQVRLNTFLNESFYGIDIQFTSQNENF